VLARLWRKVEAEPDARPLSGPPTVAPNRGPVSVSPSAASIPAPDTGPLSGPLSGPVSGPLSEVRKPATKRVRIGRLYPEPKPKPLIHARALLASIQEQCPELIGSYVPHADLDKAYGELCASEDWTRCNWPAIARQLRAMKIEKRGLKRNGERFRAAYRIPKA